MFEAKWSEGEYKKYLLGTHVAHLVHIRCLLHHSSPKKAEEAYMQRAAANNFDYFIDIAEIWKSLWSMPVPKAYGGGESYQCNSMNNGRGWYASCVLFYKTSNEAE